MASVSLRLTQSPLFSPLPVCLSMCLPLRCCCQESLHHRGELPSLVPSLLWSCSGFIPSYGSRRYGLIREGGREGDLLKCNNLAAENMFCTLLFFAFFFVLCEEQKFLHNLARVALIPLICSTPTIRRCRLRDYVWEQREESALPVSSVCPPILCK